MQKVGRVRSPSERYGINRGAGGGGISGSTLLSDSPPKGKEPSTIQSFALYGAENETTRLSCRRPAAELPPKGVFFKNGLENECENGK